MASYFLQVMRSAETNGAAAPRTSRCLRPSAALQDEKVIKLVPEHLQNDWLFAMQASRQSEGVKSDDRKAESRNGNARLLPSYYASA